MRNINAAAPFYIFDVDGTLVDSNDFHAKSWEQALHEFSFTVNFHAVRPLIGMGGDKILLSLTDLSAEDARGQKLLKRATKIFQESYLEDIAPFQGADGLLSYLKENGSKIAVASSGDPAVTEALLGLAHVLEHIDHIVCSADVDATKPDPDLISAALKRMSAAPTETLMVGDTIYDIEAASRADIQTIAFLCGGSSEDLLINKALKIFKGPHGYLHALKNGE
jgi:HAD superfamily hydrolase (TIGR01509 family)